MQAQMKSLTVGLIFFLFSGAVPVASTSLSFDAPATMNAQQLSFGATNALSFGATPVAISKPSLHTFDSVVQQTPTQAPMLSIGTN